MPKAIAAITRLFRPIPGAVIQFFTAPDDYEVARTPRRERRRFRRDLNG